MVDEESLRINFCSMILQAKGDVIANFVAWLDLKVAEYKVYGHMILTDSDDNSAAWSYSSSADPTAWPRTKQSRDTQFTNPSFGVQQNSNIGASQPRGYTGLSVNRRGHPAAVSRRGRAAFRSRPARPKSVVQNLLKNAISRSSKTSNSSTSLPVSAAPLSAIMPSTSGTELSTMTSTAQTDIGATPIKTEDDGIVTLDTDSEPEDVKPNINVASESNLWLDDTPVSMPDAAMMSYTSAASGMVQSASQQSMMSAMPHTPTNVMARPVHKPMSAPARPGLSTAPSHMSPMAPKRAPAGRDSVSELLETHTVQTESGRFLGFDPASFACPSCGNKFGSATSLKKHENVCGRFQSCRYCAARFNRRDSHHRHEKYCEARPVDVRHVYQCCHCSRVFNRPDNAKVHERKCQSNPQMQTR